MENTTLRRNAVTINKKYTEYFFPTVLTAIANNLAIIIDSVISGNILGSNALAAVNLLSPISQLYFSLTILFGLGASSLLSVAKGKNDEKLSNRIFTTTAVSLVLMSVVLIAVQLPLADTICSLLTQDASLRSLVHQYYVPFIMGTPLNLLVLCSVYFIRTDARPRLASNIIIVANVVNLIMDFVYMGVFHTGIMGAALATITGYAVGFAVALTHFFSKKSTLRFDFSLFKAPAELLESFLNMCATGVPGALGTMLITIKMLFLNTLIQSVGGRTGIVSYSVCSSSQIFMSMFITGVAQTMIPIIGVCLGEKDYNGVRYAFRRAAKVLTIASVTVTLFILAAPEPIIRFFGVTSESDIISTVSALRINSLSFIGLSFSFLLLYYYMSIQRRSFSTIISVVNGIALQIPAALILSHFFRITGIWASLVATQVGTLVVIFFMEKAARKRANGKYKDFYLIEEIDDREILSLSFKSTKENAAGVSLYLTSFLSHTMDKSKANRIAVAVEDMTADLAGRQSDKVDMDIRLLVEGENVIISIRDNGEEYDLTKAESDQLLSSLEVIRAIAVDIEYSRVLGFNRTLITI